jgi:hypothetical protein
MTLGFWPSSKWQETASRIIVFNSSSIGFRENRKAERARLIAAFREFLHGEVDFALGHVSYPSLIICRFEAETRALAKTALHAARDDAHKPCRCSRYQNESARGLCSEKAKKGAAD